MSSVFRASREVKSAYSKGFKVYKKCIESILSWLNGRTVEQLNSSIFVKFFNLSTIKLKNLFTTHYSQFTKKLFAFTLAETLVVIGIIGVVAALTLPNLNSSTGNKEKIASVKKIYAELNDVFRRATVVYGPYLTWNAYGISNSKTYDRLSDNLKIVKHCGPNETGCFASNKFNSLKSGYNYSDDIAQTHKCILSSGVSIAISPYDACSSTIQGKLCGNFYVDIDGPNKGTNTLGKDIFIFIWAANGEVVPLAFRGYEFKWGYSASAWVVNNDNMDYLNVNSNGQCNNNSSITLNETVTSCK